MQDCLLQVMQLLQFRNVFVFSTAITTHFIGQYITLTQNSLDGYKALEFGVRLLTQDQEQSLFTLKTTMPIPMSVYGDSFIWAKYDHHILPPNLSLTSNNKVGLHGTFYGCLIEFLHTDLDENLSFTLNPFIASKLDHYLLMSETTKKAEKLMNIK